MSARLLVELFDLFSREACEADKHGDLDESDRLWEIANDLFVRYVEVR